MCFFTMMAILAIVLGTVLSIQGRKGTVVASKRAHFFDFLQKLTLTFHF